MHTKEATIVSAVYMADAEGEANEHAIEALHKQAAAWGVLPEVERIFLKVGVHNHLKKQASAAVKYALDESYNGEQVRRFPVDTPELVKISADRFYLDRAKYPYAWRRKVAEALHDRITHFKVASWLNDDVKSYIEKAAGYGLGETSSLWKELARRQMLGKFQPGMAKLAEAVEAISEASDDGRIEPEVVKLACEAFSTFDSSAKIRDMVSLPEEALIPDHLTLTKVAAEQQNYVKLSNGSWIDVRNLSQEKLAAVNEGLAKVAGDREKLREQLEKLPELTADVLCSVA